MTHDSDQLRDGDEEVITILRGDGSQMTFRVFTTGETTLGEALEAMSKQNREMLKDLIDQAEVALADIEPELADIPDALTSRVPNPATPTMHRPHAASDVRTESACPWCGEPIILSRPHTDSLDRDGA